MSIIGYKEFNDDKNQITTHIPTISYITDIYEMVLSIPKDENFEDVVAELFSYGPSFNTNDVQSYFNNE